MYGDISGLYVRCCHVFFSILLRSRLCYLCGARGVDRIETPSYKDGQQPQPFQRRIRNTRVIRGTVRSDGETLIHAVVNGRRDTLFAMGPMRVECFLSLFASLGRISQYYRDVFEMFTVELKIGFSDMTITNRRGAGRVLRTALGGVKGPLRIDSYAPMLPSFAPSGIYLNDAGYGGDCT